MTKHNQQTKAKPEDDSERYGLLARVSTQAQVDKDSSIPAQLTKMRDYVSARHGAVTGTYIDEGISGTTDQRDALQQAVADAREGKFDVLLVHKSDRLFRSVAHAVTYGAIFSEAGIRLRSVTEPWFGGKSAPDQLQQGVMQVISAFYTNNLKEEIRKGHEQTVTVKGRQIGFPPYGYKRAEPNLKGSDWAIDDEAAIWVRWMYDQVLAGEIVAEITRKLNGLNVPTFFSRRSVANRPKSLYLPEGKTAKIGEGQWRPGTVTLMLKNPIYKGIVEYDSGDGKKQYPGHHEAIVDEKTWNQANELIQSRGKKRSEVSKRGLFVGGLLRCPYCGYPLHFRQARNRAAICAERRGVNIDDWTEERLWSDTYNCSRYHEIAAAKRLNGDQQSDYQMKGPDCEGFCISANTVKRLLIEHVTQIVEIASALPTRPRQVDDAGQGVAPIAKSRRVRVITEEQRRENMKDHHRKQLDSVALTRKKYFKLQVDGLMTMDELREALDELNTSKETWQNELDSLEKTAHINPPGALPAEKASTLLTTLTDENRTVRQKRDALRTAMKFVVVHPGKKSLTIHL